MVPGTYSRTYWTPLMWLGPIYGWLLSVTRLHNLLTVLECRVGRIITVILCTESVDSDTRDACGISFLLFQITSLIMCAHFNTSPVRCTSTSQMSDARVSCIWSMTTKHRIFAYTNSCSILNCGYPKLWTDVTVTHAVLHWFQRLPFECRRILMTRGVLRSCAGINTYRSLPQ